MTACASIPIRRKPRQMRCVSNWAMSTPSCGNWALHADWQPLSPGNHASRTTQPEDQSVQSLLPAAIRRRNWPGWPLRVVRSGWLASGQICRPRYDGSAGGAPARRGQGAAGYPGHQLPVLGRGFEYWLLAQLANRLQAQGRTELVISLVATERNLPARDFLASLPTRPITTPAGLMPLADEVFLSLALPSLSLPFLEFYANE